MWRDIVVAIVGLISSPYREWRKIDSKTQTEIGFLNRFLYPVFGIIALTTFIGGLWVSPEGNLQSALTATVIQIVAVFGGYYIAAYFLNEIAPRYDLERNVFRYQQFVGYSSVVLYLLSLVTPFLPKLTIIWFAAIYAFYIVYAGAANFLRVHENRRISLTVIASFIIILLPLMIKYLLELMIKVTA